MDVSIVIVSYNTCKLTLECIESVYEQTKDLEFEIFVVDNNSSDGSADEIKKKFPRLELIRSKENLGFAGANNLASKSARGQYILLLNPDTIILNNAIFRLWNFAEMNPQFGFYGGNTLYLDGSRNPTSGWMKPTFWSLLCISSGLSSLFTQSRLLNSESIKWWTQNKPIVVDIVTGCFFLIRKEHWNELQGFDSRFFMYGEDADICLRGAKKNLTSVIIPNAQIVHIGSASDNVQSEKMIKIFQSKVKLFCLHYTYREAFLFTRLLDFWCINRIVQLKFLGVWSARSREQYNKWLQIWRKRQEWWKFLSLNYKGLEK